MNDTFPSSARQLAEICERDRIVQQACEKAVAENIAHRNLQSAGAKANIESYQLLQQQLAKQVEINQRLEREFKANNLKSNIALIIGVLSFISCIIQIVIAYRR